MQRNIYLDIVKGVAIILVVYGHCIQYGTMYYVDDEYFGNPLFTIIYSFHMPLFMLVSGFLFYGSISRHSAKYNLRTRFTALLVPIIAWNTIHLLIMDTPLLLKGMDIPLLDNAKSYLTATWFLWSIFWCSIIALIVKNYLKDNIIAYILAGVVLLLLPNACGIPYHVFMYPYFITGYLWNKYNEYKRLSSLSVKTKAFILTVSMIFFTFLCMQYTKVDFIYTSGTCVVSYTQDVFLNCNQLSIDIFRYIIGFLGSACLLLLIKLTYNLASAKLKTITAAIGRKSIGIYVISVPFVNSYALSRIPFRDSIDLGGVLLRLF